MIVPLVIDGPTTFCKDSAQGASVCSLPLTTGCVADHLKTQLAVLNPRMMLLMPSAETGECDWASWKTGTIQGRVLARQGHDPVWDELEASDYLLVLHVDRWPDSALNPEFIEALASQYRGVTYAVAIGRDLERANERIECDESGHIKRVERLYASSNWPEVAVNAIAYVVAPARNIAGLRFKSLTELRRELIHRGMLSRDVPIANELIDLSRERQCLSYCQRMVTHAVQAGEPPPGFRSLQQGVWVADSCTIAPSARLVPPVVIWPHTRIEEQAVVVGPALIGPSCRVGPGAVIAQSLVLGGTTVPQAAVIRQRVLGANQRGPSPATAQAGCGERPRAGLSWVLPAAARSSPGLSRRINLALKRGVDAVVSGTALLMLSPIMALVAVLIKLDSAGPVLFGHLRERRGGREFRCYKFRTMTQDADRRQRELYKQNQVDGPQFKLDRDPRVTRVGRWLRATNLDELPQLLNVLMGHMSLVGPRPSPFRENQICVPWRQARLSVRPGITGLWQICRACDRSQGDFHEWIYYDMAYVREFSLWLDIKIVIATCLTLGGRWHVPLQYILPVRPDAGGVRRRASVPA